MKRTVSLLLVISLVFSFSTVLFSCADINTTDNGGDDGNKTLPNGSELSIIAPEWKDFGRGTVDFDKIVYEEPDFEALSALFDSIEDKIDAPDISTEENYQDIILKLSEINESLYHAYTMCSYANIMQSHDLNEKKWDEAYEKSYVGYNEYLQRFNKLLTALANSHIAERLEAEVFGEGFIAEYKDDVYSESLTELTNKESDLVSDYNAISMATVTITYEGKTDTADEILNLCKETLGEKSEEYTAAETEILSLYELKSSEAAKEIFLELVKVRRLIANEKGYSSYQTYAYENLQHEYTPSDMRGFISDVKEFIIPVYQALSSHVFYPFQKTNTPSDMDRVSLVNTVYNVISGMDGDMREVYEYMLQHKLYDVESSDKNRLDASFTTYLYDYDAPFLFVTTDGSVTDILTLSHEFGHFFDFFTSYGAEESLDLSEVSSQALEFLTIDSLDGKISDEDIAYLSYYAYENAMLNLIYSAFYTLCEEYIYACDLADITLENLNLAVERAAKEIGLDHTKVNDIYYIITPQTVISPFYMQSYATSVAAALEIFFLEKEEDGAGLAAYKSLLSRTEDMAFTERLMSVGLTSVFEDGFLKNLADTVHFYVLGYHYYRVLANAS